MKNGVNKKILLIFIGILLLLVIGIGASYAYYLATATQQGQNVINTDCFALSFDDDGQVVLSNAFPVKDVDANTVTPYHFKIKNICAQPVSYQVNLEVLSTSNLDMTYLNYKLNNGSITALSSAITTTATITGATTAKIMATGDLLGSQEVEYDLRVFLKEAVTTSDPVQNKTFKSKISVISTLNKGLISAANTIKSIVANEPTNTTNVLGTTGLAYDGTTDNNLRYVGANPNNYVEFNGELWRIIGVMNNIETEGGQTQSLLKIIRKDSLGEYSWDKSDSVVNGGAGINQWGESGSYEGADLMRELNTDYLGNITVGTEGNWYNLVPMPETTIDNGSQNMIESIVWRIGAPNNDNGTFDTNWMNATTGVNASTAYIRERGNTNGKSCTTGTNCNDEVTRTSTWTGKIALMYPSDYLYATSGGNTTNKQSCLTAPMYVWNDATKEDCKSNDWLYNSNQWQWTLSPADNFLESGHANDLFAIEPNGFVRLYGGYGTHNVRPSLYLKSSVKIVGGTGTQVDPYKLSL